MVPFALCQHVRLLSHHAAAGVLVGILAVVTVGSRPVSAQTIGPPDVMLFGQWAGPYELADIVKYDGVSYPTNEIVHLAILPPPIVPGTPPTTQYVTRVLLAPLLGLCVPKCPILPDCQVWGRTYRWTPSAPARVQQIPYGPGYPQDGSQEFFCGGHTFLKDGSLLFCNGTNVKKGCETLQGPQGHAGAWRLDTSVDPPAWSNVAATSAPLERWYPTPVLLNDGRVMNLGHVFYPTGNGEFRDLFDPAAVLPNPTWTNGIKNEQFASNCNPPLAAVDLDDYPRVHLIAAGELLWTTAGMGYGIPASGHAQPLS